MAHNFPESHWLPKPQIRKWLVLILRSQGLRTNILSPAEETSCHCTRLYFFCYTSNLQCSCLEIFNINCIASIKLRFFLERWWMNMIQWSSPQSRGTMHPWQQPQPWPAGCCYCYQCTQVRPLCCVLVYAHTGLTGDHWSVCTETSDRRVTVHWAELLLKQDQTREA